MTGGHLTIYLLIAEIDFSISSHFVMRVWSAASLDEVRLSPRSMTSVMACKMLPTAMISGPGISPDARVGMSDRREIFSQIFKVI
eukprot:COSAG01_NODE_53_length_31352_cov_23.122452_22_plen_85_part_00